MFAVLGKPVIIVVISVLVVALVYSSLSASYTSTFYVFAAPPYICFENDACPGRECWNDTFYGTATCCWTEGKTDYCQTCEVNTETGDFENCSEVTELPMSIGQPPLPPRGPQGPLGSILPGGEVLPELQQAPPSPLQPGETAPDVAPPTAPEAGEEETQPRIGDSPTGYCVPFIRNNCVPCDPGLPGADCILESEWPPTRTTDIGTPEEALGPTPPPAGPLEETAPQVAPPLTTAEDGTEQPPTEPLCHEGFERDEETGLCVPIESQQDTEQQEQASEQEQQEESQPEEDQQQSEDGGDGSNEGSDDSGNNGSNNDDNN